MVQSWCPCEISLLPFFNSLFSIFRHNLFNSLVINDQIIVHQPIKSGQAYASVKVKKQCHLLSGKFYHPLGHTDGDFSVNSAYHMLANGQAGEVTSVVQWKKIWRVEVFERICIFLWLVARGRIMTNNHLVKCRLRHDYRCEACGNVMEDTLHVLSDCSRAKRVWDGILQRELAD